MTIDFYHVPGSAPCRSVRLVANAVGQNLNLKLVNLMAGDQFKPEFLKMNPQHCVPTMDDNGFYLWESRAILGYLVEQYGKDDSLYPKDPKKRALVNQRLYFDMGTLYQKFSEYYYPVLFAGGSYDSAKLKALDDALALFNTFLDGQDWAAGSNITIADYALASTVSTIDIMGYDLSKYPNVTKWFSKTKAAIPKYDEINHSGCVEFKKMADALTAKK